MGRTAELGSLVFYPAFYRRIFARIYAVKKPFGYIFSFFGITDLLSILPGFLSLFYPPLQVLIVIRILRFQRVFHIFKMVNFTSESKVLREAIRASQAKIIVFLVSVVCVSIIMGTVMFLIEGAENGFTSIPRGVYWAIVTMTTVGYGDLTPQTPAGQAIAAFIMILGYGIIAVPTGIVTSEITRAASVLKATTTKSCTHCSKTGHTSDAKYCRYCGAEL